MKNYIVKYVYETVPTTVRSNEEEVISLVQRHYNGEIEIRQIKAITGEILYDCTREKNLVWA